MASFAKSLSFFFFLMLFSSLQIEVTGRYSFSELSPYNSNDNANDPKLPLSYEQETTPAASEVAAQTTQQAQMFALGTPKEQSFSRNQYIGYGFDDLPALDRRQPDTKDTPATRDTISSNKNVKLNNNNGNNLVYDMENDSNGSGGYNIWDEIKQQGLSDTRSLENGRYNFDLKNENKNRLNHLNGYDTARRGSIGNEAESGKQNEFDSLEEYEKYLQRRGYLP